LFIVKVITETGFNSINSSEVRKQEED